MREEQPGFEYDAGDNDQATQKPVTCLGMTFANDEARRTYFTQKLREKLQDPAFRQIEGFPIGKDEDILAISDPPYYTACPNPWIADIIKYYGKPYDPDTQIKVEPFAADTSAGKFDPIYRSHSYHTKVPYIAIKEYLSHYTRPGDLVLDFFAGSGMTGVAAKCMDDGPRHPVLIDISPEASFIAGSMMRKHEAAKVNFEHKRIAKELYQQTQDLYSKILDDTSAEINYTVWSDVFVCPGCTEELIYWNLAVDPKSGSIWTEFLCPYCGIELGKRELQRKLMTYIDPASNMPVSQTKSIPVLLDLTTNKGRIQRSPTNDEIERIVSIDPLDYSTFFPKEEMLFKGSEWGDSWRAGYHSGFSRVHHFYERRSLAALSVLYSLILSSNQRNSLLFMFSGMLPRASKLHKWKKGQTTGITTGTLYVPSLRYEYNINKMWAERISYASPVIAASGSNINVVSTQSSTSLSEIPSNSFQYIFVDPPFGDNLMYSELNFIWEAWLRVFTNRKEEAIVSISQGKGIEDYFRLMKRSLAEACRVLQPGCWMTLVFHNSKNAVWAAIQESVLSAGFVIADVRTLDKKQGSFKQINAAGAVKQDLVITAYKPNEKLESLFKLEAGTIEGVWDFVRNHLKQLPIFVSKNSQAEVVAERQNYLLFDRMVAFHVQRGVTVPISASDFYVGLTQRFSERDGMYFTPEQVAEYDKKRMTVREILQLQFFVSDETSAIQWLKQQLIKKPQTFQELHPQFLKEIGGWQKHEKQLELLELLNQNFLCYDGKGPVMEQIHAYLSTNWKELRNLSKDDPELVAKARDRWYIPDPNKAGDLEKLRERALLREFEEYKQSRKKLKVFRLEAVRAGFKKAWQERKYATIVSVADKIPTNVLEEDPKLLMWYDQAVTRLGSA
jgi:DNA modification methylase/predicted RNA-binding Zn-ribbon protein involved in translation (DUF1610 family)